MDNTNNPQLIADSPPLPQQNNGKSKIFLFLAFVIILVAGGVGGYFLGNKNQPLLPYPSPKNTTQNKFSLTTPANTTSSLPAETADWKMYSNTELGYSFKYPISWATCDSYKEGLANNSISLCSAEFQPYDYIWTSFMNNPQNVNFQQIVTKNFDETLKSNFKYTTSTIGQNSTFVTRSLPGATTSESVFFKTSSNGYIGISYQPINSDLGFSETYQGYKIFNQILSTFKFL